LVQVGCSGLVELRKASPDCCTNLEEHLDWVAKAQAPKPIAPK